MSNQFKYFLYILLASSLFFFVYKGLINSDLSYDEAGQFWLAKGLNHFSNYETPFNHLSDVWIQNRKWNLDPGGFSLIAYYWLKVSNYVMWLRLLPLLFSFLTLYFFRKLLILLSISKESATVFVLLFFLSNSLTQYSFIFRAYSLEILGVVITLYYTLLQQEKIFRWNNLLGLGLISGFFLFSRYGFAIHIIVQTFILSFFLIRLKKLDARTIFIFTVFYCVPILTSAIFLYFQQFLYHIKSDPVPMYQHQFTLMHNSFSELFALNFLSRRGLPFFIILLLVLINLYRPTFKLSKQFYLIFSWMVFMHCFTILFSLFGYYPWYIKGRWGLTLEFISLFSLMTLIQLIYLKVHESAPLLKRFKPEILSIVVICILFYRGYSSNQPCLLLLDKLKNSNTENAIINWYLTPAAKYHLKFNGAYTDMVKRKGIKFEGIDVIDSIPKRNTWVLMENPDTLVQKASFAAIKYKYVFILNKPLYQILKVQ